MSFYGGSGGGSAIRGPKVQAVYMGNPPDPKKPQQLYPTVSSRYGPQEAMLIYAEKLQRERMSYASGNRAAQQEWFRRRRQQERREELYNEAAMRQPSRCFSLPSLADVEQKRREQRHLVEETNRLIRNQCCPYNKFVALI
eukprot:gnl/TRDRNA2_/TRDRNA2_193178_c0_seq1.p1 gnl/TRDRNA2_/TRDRNA2_193178_c0~~gnl/TRDRNA2_/TRDRNA2_193178_c0_seq1.p1  ORF type:complete len:141 (-),score=29.19 gnl/TRDRNA2_/TRDRNA2_193178_c0_seq1:63-485(-)